MRLLSCPLRPVVDRSFFFGDFPFALALTIALDACWLCEHLQPADVMTTLDEYIASASRGELPDGLSAPLEALWYEVRGEWKRAHEIVQAQSTTEAAWVHAYLHRKEGDLSNAGYWYRRAGRGIPAATLEDEWRTIAASFIEGEALD